MARNHVWRYTLRLFHTFAIFEKKSKNQCKKDLKSHIARGARAFGPSGGRWDDFEAAPNGMFFRWRFALSHPCIAEVGQNWIHFLTCEVDAFGVALNPKASLRGWLV